MLHRKARYFIEIIIHALFWAGVYYVLRSLTASSFSMVTYDDSKPTGGFSANMLFPYPGLVLGILMIMFYGNIFWLFRKLVQRKKNTGWIMAIFGWFVSMVTINYFAISKMTDAGSNIQHNSAHHYKVHLPASSTLMPPPPPEMSFTSNDWQHMQLMMAIIFLAVLGIAVAYFFIKEWIRNDLVRSRAEAQQFSTEIKFLRSQVNPHFLFNTLNNLFSMAQKKGDDEVADGISKLSGMMRYMIYESNTENVPLQKEIEYLQDCIALNKLRYADNEVSVQFDYPPKAVVGNINVAPILFIPFLENAFKHGVLIGRHSNIAMSISLKEKRLIFTCENTDYNAVKKLSEEQNGIGLENIRRRLQLVYPDRHVLNTGPEDGKYFVNLQIDIA